MENEAKNKIPEQKYWRRWYWSLLLWLLLLIIIFNWITQYYK